MRKRALLHILRAGIVLAAAAVLIWGGFMWTTRRPFPKTRGTIRLPGLTDRVEIIRDTDGVPHIYAQSMEDLFFAQGYVHAQDRFWQMELWRRIGSGRLAELFGEDLLDVDMFLRIIGFHRLAEQDYVNMDQEARRFLDAYTQGVNACIMDRAPSRLGLEFYLLKLGKRDVAVKPWTGTHSISWGAGGGQPSGLRYILRAAASGADPQGGNRGPGGFLSALPGGHALHRVLLLLLQGTALLRLAEWGFQQLGCLRKPHQNRVPNPCQ